MMIFILASGYLLTVYLLLALVKRTGTAKKSGFKDDAAGSQNDIQRLING
ncbi:hypothetical protein VB711_13665 [Cronbergia sp. UHCC 0137]|nr:hypothetical protein [Cronbergia sp. UHCC 0137]MEA5618878.1 hypothetical protein [Cronbergia sp. UHCC 0137]